MTLLLEAEKPASVTQELPKDLSEVIAQAQTLFSEQRYHETCDVLSLAQNIDSAFEEKLEVRLSRCVLDILCQMALSNLVRAQDAWLNIEDIFTQRPSLANFEIMLLGARLHMAAGEIEKALWCSQRALALATSSRERILAQTYLVRIKFQENGDACFALEQLLPHWSALKADGARSSGRTDVGQQLRLALVVAALAQGKLNTAREVIGSVEKVRSITDLEMHLLDGVIKICSGENEEAVRIAQDGDLIQVQDGSSRQERVAILWWQTWIFHAAGRLRDAQQKAEEAYDLILATNAGGYHSQVILLLASCLIQRKSYRRASSLLQAHLGREIGQQSRHPFKLNVPLEALSLCCEALLLYEEQGLRRVRSYLQEHSTCLLDASSIMIVSLFCLAHEQFLVLLCKSFGVEHLPTELTDLLDTPSFQPCFHLTEKQLHSGEAQRLRLRFPQCTAQSEQSFVHHRKPIEIRLFGGLELRVIDSALDLRSWGDSKTRSLFVSLALASGGEMARDMLIERLWPEAPSENVRNVYNVTWWQMRKRIFAALPLKSDDTLEVIDGAFQNTGGRCGLKEHDTYVDVREFSELAIKLTDYLHAGNKRACLSVIKKMTDIYQGDLLPGDRYLDWLDAERRHLRKQFRDAILLGVEICLEQGEFESSLFYLHRAKALGIDGEDLRYLSMKTYAAAGRREEAMTAFHECRQYLNNELGLDPSPHIMDMYQQLLCECT
ncbi:MAG: bacterial transcriptional activator domain-containing protein [Coriobacteriia bacterium]|nr:bacterial transcriptional activator domain-containing protein [Coriobacteriia bacterium]